MNEWMVDVKRERESHAAKTYEVEEYLVYVPCKLVSADSYLIHACCNVQRRYTDEASINSR